MKKILGLSILLLVLSVAASAQNLRFGQGRRYRGNQLSLGERVELRQDALRYRALKRRSERDGFIGPVERRRLQRARMETRRDEFYFRHNGRRRLI